MKSNLMIVGGGGNFTKYLLQRFTNQYGKNLSTKVDNVFLLDINPEAAENNARKYGLPSDNCYSEISDGLMNTIDGVIISTPANKHYETARDFISENKPTWIAKPLDANLWNAEKLAQSAPSINMSGIEEAYSPALMDMLQYIQDNNIQIKNAYIEWNKNRGPRDHQVPGVNLEEGSHPFACLNMVLPGIPDNIYADGNSERVLVAKEKYQPDPVHSKKPVEGKYDGEDVFWVSMLNDYTSMLRYDNARAVVNSCWHDPAKESSIRVVGFSPELGKDDPFQGYISMYANLTAIGKDAAEQNSLSQRFLEITSGYTSGRSGQGYLLERKEYGSSIDTLGNSLEIFLDSVAHDRQHPKAISFKDELDILKIMTDVEKQVNPDYK
ncbi:MAG: Gfo/Idh/MocA family protein [Nanobdellota archaeon]